MKAADGSHVARDCENGSFDPVCVRPITPHRSSEVDKGLAGGAPGAPATYLAMCHIFCDSVEAYQQGFSPHAQEIMGDIPNYTDVTPVVQISEVVIERS